ncbi:thioredoxin family protein [Flavobacterium sp. LC2016-12]|uniref:thioredoxin family protein n=1 Tax=Flavobacterium sp. LC2016-12 TaxID=2783794 RepID=UPI00188C3E7D|nr:thioredoxin family protein [Flavobacterium sp. LC2016-12]MBF4465599.1 thioredoxin family protein [Flavobacterium sp. LC2016-12]
MKKYLIIAFVFISQINHASNWYTSLEEAQAVALSSNKLIIIDFVAKWCGPCKEMDSKSWNNIEVEEVLKNYIKLRIDVDSNRDIALRYQIRSIPDMVIIDANEKILHRFKGYQNPLKLKNELFRFNLSTEYLATELINFHQQKKYNTAIRISQKYYTYSLLVNSDIKGKILKVGSDYLEDAKQELNKKEENYLQKKQKLELLTLYELAYNFDFEKLDKKISEIKVEKIDPLNNYQYWFLKYLSLKGNQKDITETEEFLKKNELENVTKNANQLYAFYEKSVPKI